MRRLPASVLSLTFILFFSASEAADRKLGHYEDLSAFVAETFSCSRTATVTVRAPDESAFQGDRIAFQKLLGGVRIALDLECPGIEEIVILGKKNMKYSRTIYRGVVAQVDDWQLKDIWEPGSVPEDEDTPPDSLPDIENGQDGALSLAADAQTRLNALGYHAGPADGQPGAMTRKAIRAFQRDYSLTVDGEVSQGLLVALQEAASSPKPPRTPSPTPPALPVVKDPASLPAEYNILGTWYGSYTCEQEEVGVTLTLERKRKKIPKTNMLIQELSGELSFYPIRGNANAPTGRALIDGGVRFPSRAFSIRHSKWLEQPANQLPIGIAGYVSLDAQRLSGAVGMKGRLAGGRKPPSCSDLHLTRERPVIAASTLPAEPTSPETAVAGESGTIDGTWKGSYVCSRKPVGMTLSITREGETGLAAIFELYPLNLDDASGPFGIAKGSYRLRGSFDDITQAFELKPTEWIETPARRGTEMVGLSGLLGEAGDQLSGSVLHQHCDGFEAARQTQTEIAGPERTSPPVPIALADAKTIRERCEVFVKWAGRMAEEYPDIDIRHTIMAKLLPKAANLYTDEHFIPVFGVAYDQLDTAAREDIKNQQFACSRRLASGHPEKAHYGQLLSSIATDPFSSDTEHKSVASVVAARRALKVWSDRVIDGITRMEGTPENAEKLEEYLEKGARDLAELWPSEQARFKEAILARRADMAASILEKMAADDSLAMTLQSVREIESLQDDYAGDLKQLPDNRRQALEKRLDEKKDAVLADVTRQELEQFRDIPINVETAQHIERWHKRFRGLYGRYSSRAPVAQALNVYAEERAAKLELTLTTLLTGLRDSARATPVSFDGVKRLREEWGALETVIVAIDTARRDDFQRVVDEKTGAVYDALAQEAKQRLNGIGSGYADVIPVLEATTKEAAPFEEADARQWAFAIYGAGVARAEELLDASYPGFLKELEAIEPEMGAGEALRELAWEFRQRTDGIEGFATYEEAAFTAAEVMDRKWCEKAFEEAGFGADEAQRLVLSRVGAVGLRDLVCNAALNGYVVERTSTGLFSDAMAMEITGPSEEEARIEFAEEGEDGEKVLVGQRRAEEALPREEWMAYADRMGSPRLSGIPDRADATDCDRLAGDPEDPSKIGQGVAWEQVDLDRATRACVMALEYDPANARLQYQMGRLLVLAGAQDAALEFFELADEAGYGIASYQLAETLSIDGGIEEEYIDTARAYYARAAQTGYEPGREKAAEMDTILATMRPTFDARTFRRPELMKAAYEGDIDTLKRSDGAELYLQRVVGAYSEICGNVLPAGMQEEVYRILMEDRLGKGAMDNPEAFAAGGLRVLIDELARYANPGKMILDEMEAESLVADAETDIGTMSSYYECGSVKIEPLWNNVMAFFRSIQP